MTHEAYMQEALKEARACIPQGDVPVGCVIVSPEGEIIGRGRNRREAEGRATAHAEVEAINMACAALGSWRHVRRGHHQCPHRCGALRGERGQVRMLRVGAQPL